MSLKWVNLGINEKDIYSLLLRWQYKELQGHDLQGNRHKWWKIFLKSHLKSLEIVLRHIASEKTCIQKNLQNSVIVSGVHGNRNMSFLLSLHPPAQFDGSPIQGSCDQEDEASSTLSPQSRDLYLSRKYRSPVFSSSPTLSWRGYITLEYGQEIGLFFHPASTHRTETLFQIQQLENTGILITLTPASF